MTGRLTDLLACFVLRQKWHSGAVKKKTQNWHMTLRATALRGHLTVDWQFEFYTNSLSMDWPATRKFEDDKADCFTSITLKLTPTRLPPQPTVERNVPIGQVRDT